MRYQPIGDDDLRAATDLAEWTRVGDALSCTFRCGSFGGAGALAAKVCALADQMDHHPDIDLRYPDVVLVTTTTHATGGLTDADLALARGINALVELSR